MRAIASCCFVAVVLLVLSVFPSHPQIVHPNHHVVWFETWMCGDTGKLQACLNPILLVEGQKLTQIPSACDKGSPAYAEFSSKFLSCGQRYTVLYGGSTVGELSVVSSGGYEETTLAHFTSRSPILADHFGLATNGKTTLIHQSPRRALTKLEINEATSLAKDLFRRFGLAEKLIANVRTDVAAIKLGTPQEDALIGSFRIDVPGDSEGIAALFFIASWKDGRLVPEFSWHKISSTGNESERMNLVDQVDLFGDGQQEVITRVNYYEDWSYRVYRRDKSTAVWEMIFQSDTFGCE